jgi:hypothetical protein
MAGGRGIVALAKNPNLDRIIIGHIDEAVKANHVISDAESRELSSDGDVSGTLRVAEERKEALEGWVALLQHSDIMKERGFAASGGFAGRKELELVWS